MINSVNAGTARVTKSPPLIYGGKDLWSCERDNNDYDLCRNALCDIATILEFNGYAQESEILAKAISRL
jgi:hypothetical protein